MTDLFVKCHLKLHIDTDIDINYVRKTLTKKECFKTLTEDGQRRG